MKPLNLYENAYILLFYKNIFLNNGDDGAAVHDEDVHDGEVHDEVDCDEDPHDVVVHDEVDHDEVDHDEVDCDEEAHDVLVRNVVVYGVVGRGDDVVAGDRDDSVLHSEGRSVAF